MIFLLASFLLGCSSKHDESRSAKIQLRDMEGNVIDLDQFEGKTVFLNFWATWCVPCIAEMPSIQRAKEMLAGQEIEFVLASNESVDRITAFREQKKIRMNVVQLLNQEELLIQVLPTTYIISAKGEIVFSEAGAREWDSPENIGLITKIINGNE